MNKPTFKNLSEGVNPVEIDGRVYNASPKGPGNFHTLREANYGKGFVQGTFGNQLVLVHGAYLNQDNSDARTIVETSKNHYILGNTAINYAPQLVIVQDMPEVRDGRIVMDEKSLTAKLSKNAKNGVRFSDDESIRALSYGFETGWQTTDQIRINPFSIALTGNVNAPEMLAEIQDKISKKGYIWALGQGTNNEIRVPGLNEDVDSLDLDGDWDGFGDDRSSFGVRQ